MKCSKDAEANDMIHISGDHRCVMATFVINTPKKDGSHETNKDKLGTTKQNNRKQTNKKKVGEEESTFENKPRDHLTKKEQVEAENTDLKQSKEKNRKDDRSRMQKIKETWRENSSAIQKKLQQDRIQEKQVQNSQNIACQQTRWQTLSQYSSQGRRGCGRADRQRDREQSSLSQMRPGGE